MRVIILADRLGHELLPLTDTTCPALLPVTGKPVLEHTLDMLVAAGLKQATIVIGPFAEQVRAFAGDGQRWGMALDYWVARGEETPVSVLAQIAQGPCDYPLLLLRGDMLRTPCLSEFLQLADGRTEAVLHVLAQGSATGMALAQSAEADLSPLHWPVLAEGLPIAAEAAVECGGSASRLESLAAYHQANLAAAAGRLPGLLVPGRQTALGLTQGKNSQVSPASLKVGNAFVGDGCRIHRTAELSGEVVIGDHVIIDPHTRLADTLVLPHTYVGELVDLRNAIVRGNDLIRVDTGTHLRLADTFLLADLRDISVGGSLAPGLHRLAGGVLLLLSLPLWPVAAWAARGENPQGPLLRPRRLRGNRIELSEFGERQRAEFKAWEWATRRPLLRSLPHLLGVVSGDLRLVGVEPVSLEQAERRTEEWERLADQAPAGLIGPTQLRLPASAPEEERLMSDAYYARQRGPGKNWPYLGEALLALFNRRAWRLED
ncbi:MAG: sugar phosphate nucleotidyltransferase [Candidatus Methylumidiphilus sp.]